MLLDLTAPTAWRSQPELASGDGALGFWKALREVYGTTREQRMLGAQDRQRAQQAAEVRPATRQGTPTGHLDGFETKRDAEKAFDFFLEAYGAKYDKAGQPAWLKDRDVLLAVLSTSRPSDWKHIRTTNPIESTFATVRLRTTKTR